ncbi:hypothetical protein [Yoonia sediminilitoris]|uniref:Uncharacterized protein n=1 Tax=Yoonia sediminilitoris TaxID=1286148 RepID=A0A2T6KRY7_9RHOB|nr:hypothetical protein [Yoonia sediminilitoris]PUB19318.1 hypothetical protein C8N45_101915 [Yoonia sediminilitoris]RCW99486.1 hypothetical protein DFP92_101915 [Yoonia sediminilitoris]
MTILEIASLLIVLAGAFGAINALSLPDSGWKLLILAATYVVVIFSIIVPGLIAAKVAGRQGRTPDCRNDPFLCL